MTNPEMAGAMRKLREKTAPKVGEYAPDFTLPTPDKSDEVTLSTLCREKPVVLVFGNYSCGPFKRETAGIRELHATYGEAFTFLFVYVREAHPLDGWTMEISHITDPKTDEERRTTAGDCALHYQIGFKTVVDTLDDAVGSRYNGWPERLYLIGTDQTVRYAGGIGPGGVVPRIVDAKERDREVESSLEWHLQGTLNARE